MAILQFLSPLLYIAVAGLFYHLSFGKTANEILALTPPLRKLEIFVFPVIIGGLILFTRRAGYYLVVIGSVYLIVRGVMEFIASNETDPVFPLVLTSALCLVVVATLLRQKTRSVYFNPRLRWWETSPRYVTSFPASIIRIGGKPMKATLQNVASGGAGLETTETGYLKDEIVDVTFQNEGVEYHLKAKIVWEKDIGSGKQYLGVEWAEENSPAEGSKLRRLIRGLKAKRVPTTRSLPPRMNDVKEWFAKIAG
jgi:hypothetical protein